MWEGEWRGRAEESQAEVEQLTRWASQEVIEMEHETAGLNAARLELKEDIHQLKKQIAQEQKNSQQLDPFLSLKG